jgi:hypothetical protein
VTLRRYDDCRWSPRGEVPLFYENPLGGAYQEYVGGTYHAMEMFNDYYRAADFTDPKRMRIGESRISWQRISGWLPWMKMRSASRRHDLQRHRLCGSSTSRISRSA